MDLGVLALETNRYDGCISTPEGGVLATNNNGKHWAALKEVMFLSMNC